MTLDQRARAAASALHDRIDTFEVPDVGRVRRTVRRRRAGRTVAVAAMAIVTAVGVTALVNKPAGDGIVAGPGNALSWDIVDKAAAGIGAGTGISAVASGGDSAVAVGSAPSGDWWSAAAWHTDDGLTWTPAEHPDSTGDLHAIAFDGDTALAIGTESQRERSHISNFVWRSDDGGRTWTEIARGDLFGDAAPEMGRPGVNGLLRRDGTWLAYGAGSSGYTGVWVSSDGVTWEPVAAPGLAGSVDRVVERADGSLFGHWATLGWFPDDVTHWGDAVELSLPAGRYLNAVAPGASFGFAASTERHGLPTPLVRSADGGRTWTIDPRFLDEFPDAFVWSVTQVDGGFVAAGQSGTPNHPDAWISPDGESWQQLPPALYGGPGGTLSLVADVGERVVLLGTAPEIDRYYIIEKPL